VRGEGACGCAPSVPAPSSEARVPAKTHVRARARAHARTRRHARARARTHTHTHTLTHTGLHTRASSPHLKCRGPCCRGFSGNTTFTYTASNGRTTASATVFLVASNSTGVVIPANGPNATLASRLVLGPAGGGTAGAACPDAAGVAAVADAFNARLTTGVGFSSATTLFSLCEFLDGGRLLVTLVTSVVANSTASPAALSAAVTQAPNGLCSVAPVAALCGATFRGGALRIADGCSTTNATQCTPPSLSSKKCVLPTPVPAAFVATYGVPSAAAASFQSCCVRAGTLAGLGSSTCRKVSVGARQTLLRPLTRCACTNLREFIPLRMTTRAAALPGPAANASLAAYPFTAGLVAQARAARSKRRGERRTQCSYTRQPHARHCRNHAAPTPPHARARPHRSACRSPCRRCPAGA
jgi:hypothetical protein